MIEFINPGFVIMYILLLIVLVGMIITSSEKLPVTTTMVAIATFVVFYYLPNDLYQKVKTNTDHFKSGGTLVCYKILDSTSYKVSKDLGWRVESTKTIMKEDNETINKLLLQNCDIRIDKNGYQ